MRHQAAAVRLTFLGLCLFTALHSFGGAIEIPMQGARAAGRADAFTAQVFATALGGGMSSRLFQEAREKRGLCYAIYAFSHSYRDTGIFGIYCGTSAAKAGEIAPLLATEIAAMTNGTTEEEVARARAQLKASLLMGLELPQARCEMMANHLHIYGRVLSVDELVRRIDVVLDGAARFFAQFPQDRLGDQLPGRPRSYAHLAWQLFNVVDAFLEHENGSALRDHEPVALRVERTRG